MSVKIVMDAELQIAVALIMTRRSWDEPKGLHRHRAGSSYIRRDYLHRHLGCAMNKTLKIELSDQHKATIAFLRAAMHNREGALRHEHESHCEFRANVEQKCDCNLSAVLHVLKGEI